MFYVSKEYLHNQILIQFYLTIRRTCAYIIYNKSGILKYKFRCLKKFIEKNIFLQVH